MNTLQWFVWPILVILTFEVIPLQGRSSITLRAKKLRGTKKASGPHLTKKEWKDLHKFEDALKSEDGQLMYTNSWAVQLDSAEVEAADRIASKHGFVNLGQVRDYFYWFIIVALGQKVNIYTTVLRILRLKAIDNLSSNTANTV